MFSNTLSKKFILNQQTVLLFMNSHSQQLYDKSQLRSILLKYYFYDFKIRTCD